MKIESVERRTRYLNELKRNNVSKQNSIDEYKVKIERFEGKISESREVLKRRGTDIDSNSKDLSELVM